MDIFKACRTDNLSWLRQQKLSDQLSDLMQKDQAGRYPHELAARNGHLDIVKWLVMESGQPVDATADDNDAVRSSAANGHLSIVKWLVQESGQPVDVTADDDDAVRSAAANGHLDLVKWLIEDSYQPVDITARDNTAVLWASESGHTAVVDYLNFVTPLIQAVGLTVCRSVGFDAVSDMLTAQVVSKSTTRRL